MVCDHSCTSGVCQELNPQARIYKLRGLTRLPSTKPPPRVIIYKLEVNGTWIFTTQVNTSFYKFHIPNLSPSQLTISLVKLKDHKITTNQHLIIKLSLLKFVFKLVDYLLCLSCITKQQPISLPSPRCYCFPHFTSKFYYLFIIKLLSWVVPLKFILTLYFSWSHTMFLVVFVFLFLMFHTSLIVIFFEVIPP